VSGKDLDLAGEIGNPFHLPVAGEDEFDLGRYVCRGEDQRVGHPEGFVASTEIGCPLGDLHVHGEDLGSQLEEEAAHLLLVMAPEMRPGQNLGVGHGRHQELMAADEVAYRLVSRTMKSVAAIDKTDHRIGIENYRHSSRRPFTCLRREPPV